ncbi:tRNA-binding protein [Diaphorobacter sp. DS2]|uniref:Putative secretion chaperone CsaA n=1 Tax=Comamonas testosteroni CNB-1 TaxID=543891 RepID=A7K7L2_COMTE|nr:MULTISPECIES: tRNA-binding protein [Comamonas]ABM06237.1 putative secretion chaperone CsaA [Comamonas testosteroni CNB-1]MDO1476912.1 tRNA-binding protein [Comamonas thiooxydans]TFI47958.1 tRNA-binding protein [Diaphorobacter sp. DS2]
MHYTQDPNTPASAGIGFDDFLKVDIRVGTILSAQAFPEARKPAYKLTIDFGSGVGIRKSSAQITARYALPELAGKRVMAVVNFPPRQIGPVKSEVLVLSFADEAGGIVLAVPDDQVPNGTRLT